MTRRRKGASDSCFYYKWLDKALCDLQAARLLLTYGGDHYNIAFHCQQAIEKALKGYLLFRTGRHFDGHNLTWLCKQAMQTDYHFSSTHVLIQVPTVVKMYTYQLPHPDIFHTGLTV